MSDPSEDRQITRRALVDWVIYVCSAISAAALAGPPAPQARNLSRNMQWQQSLILVTRAISVTKLLHNSMWARRWDRMDIPGNAVAQTTASSSSEWVCCIVHLLHDGPIWFDLKSVQHIKQPDAQPGRKSRPRPDHTFTQICVQTLTIYGHTFCFTRPQIL